MPRDAWASEATRQRPSPDARDDVADARRLATVAAVLDAAGVRWWVDHGTLLGLVRDGRPLPWDDDIDLSFRAPEHAAVVRSLATVKPRLQARLIVTDRGVKVKPYGEHERTIDVAPYRELAGGTWEKQLLRVAPGVGAGRRRGRDALRWLAYRLDAALGHLDRWVWSTWTPPAVWARPLIGFTSLVAAGRERFGRAQASRVGPGHFERLGTVRWGALSLPAPADPEAYLSLRYGRHWRVPRQTWTWWDDDDTIVAPMPDGDDDRDDG